jgi:dipeptidyl aminopeptidase/acylaminoacyl peptidase
MRCALLLSLLLALGATGESAAAVLVYQRPASRAIVAARADGSRPRVIAHGLRPSVAPDGRHVGFFKTDRNDNDMLYVVGIGGGRPRLLAREVFEVDTPPVAACDWSQDGRLVVVGDVHGTGAFVVDIGTGKRRRVPLESNYGGASFSPSGNQIAIVDAFPHGSFLHVITTSSERGHQVANGAYPLWSRAGIAFSEQTEMNPVLALKRRPSGRARQLVVSSGLVMYSVAWSGDAATILAAEGDSFSALTALLVDRKSGASRSLPQTFTSVDGLSRDGNTVLAELGSNVVAVASDGATKTLAPRAVAASWTR